MRVAFMFLAMEAFHLIWGREAIATLNHDVPELVVVGSFGFVACFLQDVLEVHARLQKALTERGDSGRRGEAGVAPEGSIAGGGA